MEGEGEHKKKSSRSRRRRRSSERMMTYVGCGVQSTLPWRVDYGRIERAMQRSCDSCECFACEQDQSPSSWRGSFEMKIIFVSHRCRILPYSCEQHMRRIEYSSVQGSLQHSGAINRTTTQKHVRKPRGSEEEQEQESYSEDLKAPAAVVDGGGGSSAALLRLPTSPSLPLPLSLLTTIRYVCIEQRQVVKC